METGDKVPEVLGLDAEGREVRLADYAGRRLVLYFYPKDNTPGCTAEACSLRDHYDELRAAGYEVVGVSVDSAASHQRFSAKHALPFMGTVRTTFIIAPDGRVERILGPKEIKTKTHGEQLLGLGA